MIQKVSIERVATGWVAFASASLAFAAVAAGQNASRLFEDPAASGVKPTAAQIRAVGVLRKLPGIADVQPVIVNGRLLRGLAPVDVNPTPGGKSLPLHGRATTTDSNRFVWHGDSRESGASAVFVARDGRTHGAIWAPPNLFEIRPLGGNLHAVLSVDPRACGDVCPPGGDIAGAAPLSRLQPPGAHGVPLLATAADPDPCALAPGQVRRACPEEVRSEDASIKVLVVYTAAAREAVRDPASEGGVPADIASAIELAVETTNGTFTASRVHIDLELAHSYETGYQEEELQDGCANLEVDVQRLRERSDGFLDEVHRYRDAYEADIVVLLIGWRECYGMASPPILARDETAFAVVSVTHASSCFTFAHEIGHLLGAQHAECPGLAAFECGQGLCALVWYTIMARGSECGESSLFRIGRWSNPAVNYSYQPLPSEPTGTDSRNNARVLNATAGTVAGFRSTGTLVVVPRSLLIRKGSSAGLRAEVRRAGESQERPLWVHATAANTAVVSVAEWSESDESGVTPIAVHGRALGRTTISLHAEGVAVSVRVTVVPSLCMLALLALLVSVAWLALHRARTQRGG